MKCKSLKFIHFYYFFIYWEWDPPFLVTPTLIIYIYVISQKVNREKTFFKISCIYLLLKKLVNKKYFLVNEKHFLVNRNTFRSTKNTFQLKKNLIWFSGKCFPEKFGRKTLSEIYEKFRNAIICWLYQIWSSNF
jgi:hypothetical protein